ncbi:MAG: menaquinone biosynthesis protein [Proteobacteria bacterium]|nr:menaquinone biosynthesis protein [Pseudomonadota bacterium]MBU1737166.1 menaquinone biosynthesis protein [Pseudomonadota bacterium]
MKSGVSARIGMVNFINTAPIYEVWKSSVKRTDWQVVEAAPSELNRRLFMGELDLGFISSHEYAAHPDKYMLLDDLSISATGEVGSVFLFSKVAPENLSGARVLLSAQSQTSISLLAIILEKFYQVVPRYEKGAIGKHLSDLAGYDAVLAIGDEALRLSGEKIFPLQMDLGHAWHQETGLPFVFAVWAVREEFRQAAPDTVLEIHRELLRCRKAGLANLTLISALVAPRIPMPIEACVRYLQGIQYDLDAGKQKALQLFIEYLIERGEAHPDSLPLKICD